MGPNLCPINVDHTQLEIKRESRGLLWTIYLLISFKGIKYTLAGNTRHLPKHGMETSLPNL